MDKVWYGSGLLSWVAAGVAWLVAFLLFVGYLGASW